MWTIRTPGSRMWHAVAAVAAITATVSGAGCGDDEYKRAGTISPRPVVASIPAAAPPPTGSEMVFGTSGPPDMASSLGNQSILGATGTYGKNLADKGQAYSQLVYAFNTLAESPATRDSIKTVAVARKALTGLGSDDNVTALRDLGDKLQTVLDADALLSKLTIHRISARRVPWADGGYVVDQELRKAAAPARPGALPRPVKPSDREAIQAASDWASKYHESPESVRVRMVHDANDAVEALYVALNEERKAAKTFTVSRQGWNLHPNAANDPYSETGKAVPFGE